MTKRKGYLDFLKFIATVIIIFHHYQQSTGAYFSGWINFYNGEFYWGYMVELFFIISGFCIYRYEEYIAEGNVTLKDFYLKRLLRLLPMLFLGAVLYELASIAYARVYGMDWLGVKPSLWGTITDIIAVQEGWVFRNAFDKLFSMNIWGFLGKISFAAFIFHGPFIPMLYVVDGKFGFDCNYNNISTMIVFCAIVFLGAIIGYYFYERPINSWIQKKGK